jgi:hypothetical protein
MNGGKDLDRWHRPYGWTADMIPEWLALAASSLAVATGVMLTAAIIAEGRLTGLGALVLVACFGPFIVAIWLLRRRLRVGVYVGPAGLRIQETLAGRTLPWPSIAAVENRITSRWSPLGPFDAEFIWVVPHDGRPIRTPLQRFGGGLLALLLGSRWFDHAGVRRLDWDAYDRTVRALQDLVAQAQSRPPGRASRREPRRTRGVVHGRTTDKRSRA